MTAQVEKIQGSKGREEDMTTSVSAEADGKRVGCASAKSGDDMYKYSFNGGVSASTSEGLSAPASYRSGSATSFTASEKMSNRAKM